MLDKKAFFWRCKQHIKSDQFVQVREKSRADGTDMLGRSFLKFIGRATDWCLRVEKLILWTWVDYVDYVVMWLVHPHPIFCNFMKSINRFLIPSLPELFSQREKQTISDLDNEIEAKENSIPLPFPLLDTNVYSEQVLTFHSSPLSFPLSSFSLLHFQQCSSH